jgi:hypothetical protein
MRRRRGCIFPASNPGNEGDGVLRQRLIERKKKLQMNLRSEEPGAQNHRPTAAMKMNLFAASGGGIAARDEMYAPGHSQDAQSVSAKAA